MNVLHIDNSDFFRNSMHQYMSENGFGYHGVSSKEEAMGILETQRFDLIVTALELADDSGITLVKALNESPHRSLPVIVLTGTDNLSLRKKLFSLGVVDYIRKGDVMTAHFSRYLKSLKMEEHLMHEIRQIPIAVLDDSKLTQKVISKIFDFFSITNVDYYTEADELLKSGDDYGVYLIDIVLPKHSGEEIVMALREKTDDARILAISSIDNYKAASNILNAGADDFILKPFDVNIFMARLKTNARTYSLIQHLKARTCTHG